LTVVAVVAVAGVAVAIVVVGEGGKDVARVWSEWASVVYLAGVSSDRTLARRYIATGCVTAVA